MSQSRIGRVLAVALVSAAALMLAGGCKGSPIDLGPGDAGMPGEAGGGGAGAGGGGNGGEGTGSFVPPPPTCADITCDAPAMCDDSSGEAECFCPEGYADVQGDGSLCEDIDECDEGTDDCPDTKTCENTPGGFECTGVNECRRARDNDCDANATCTDTAAGYDCACNPPWTGDGKTCGCPSGYTKTNGDCLADDGTACEDDANCLNGHCVGGICCAQACDGPATCQTTNGATCADGATCAYPTSPNGEACTGDANPCTVDKCMDGICDTSTPKVCDDTAICADGSCDAICTDDTCDPSDLDGDPCHFTPNAAACDDGNPCTDPDTCSNTFCDGALRNCGDGNVCTTDGCDPSTLSGDPCTHTNNTAGCSDGNACTMNDTCSGGTCSVSAPVVCDDTNPCTTDSCNTSLGCQYTNNSLSCTDNNACTGPGATGDDTCSGGACVPGVGKNCDDGNVCTTDTCTPSDTDGQPCVHTNNMVACIDTNPCTTTSSCSGGTCSVGSGNACGPNSTGCTPNGSSRTCDCSTIPPPGYIDDGSGYCVPLTNECLSNPCDTSPVATCLDPTPDGSVSNDYVCTCPAGYTGNGRGVNGCTDINECSPTNPCGAGRGTCNNTPGSYTCSCNTGYTAVGGTCVCDLNGTWAIRITTNMTWSGITNIVNGGATTYSWALRNHSYLPDGTLDVETIPCGGTSPTLCGTGGLIPAEAYAQFLTNQIWGITSMPTEMLSMSVPNALPGQAFTTAQTAVLLGIHLTNPAGTWPSANQNVGSGPGNPGTNGSYWTNDDNSGDLGVEAYAVPPGGISDNNTVPDPPVNYASTSSCTGSLAYAWWPAAEGFSVRRVKRWSLASRVISYLDGSISSCNLITGDVKGPQGGQMQNNSRVKSCTVCASGSTAGCSDEACSGTVVDFFDNQPQPPPPTITGATFRIEPIDVSAAGSTNAACEMVREQLCPFGAGVCN